jgi:carbon storage regulator
VIVKGIPTFFQAQGRKNMLVLTRGLKQKILIGDEMVTVTVLEVKGGRVRLGIEAPDNVSIRRHELVPGMADAVGSTCVH